MSDFAVGDRVRFWGGARPEGLPGVIVMLEVAGIPGCHIVNVQGTEVIANVRSLTRAGA
jgi:hypothetical protein